MEACPSGSNSKTRRLSLNFICNTTQWLGIYVYTVVETPHAMRWFESRVSNSECSIGFEPCGLSSRCNMVFGFRGLSPVSQALLGLNPVVQALGVTRGLNSVFGTNT